MAQMKMNMLRDCYNSTLSVDLALQACEKANLVVTRAEVEVYYCERDMADMY